MEDESETMKGSGRFGVSRKQWVAAALGVLETRGIEAIRIQSLAEKVGVNKSGFYWHFRDREELLQALLSHWGDLEEVPLVNLGDGNHMPEDILRSMADSVDRENLSGLDAAVRQWAKSDGRVADVYRQKMERRLSFVRSLFEELGFEGADLDMRAQTYVAYVTTERDVFPDLTPEQRATTRKARLNMLLSR